MFLRIQYHRLSEILSHLKKFNNTQLQIVCVGLSKLKQKHN